MTARVERPVTREKHSVSSRCVTWPGRTPAKTVAGRTPGPAFIAVRRWRLANVAKELRLLLAERTAAATPAERRAVAKEMDRRARWETYIRKAVDSAPPLTAAQRDKLALLLRPTGGFK